MNNSGASDVSLINDGEADAPVPAAIIARWTNGRLVAADALSGFELRELPGQTMMRFELIRAGSRLPPGARLAVGWVRLQTKDEVRLELEEAEESRK